MVLEKPPDGRRFDDDLHLLREVGLQRGRRDNFGHPIAQQASNDKFYGVGRKLPRLTPTLVETGV